MFDTILREPERSRYQIWRIAVPRKGRRSPFCTRPTTGTIFQDLTPQDLPALLQAERCRAEEHEERRQREEFVREVQEDLNQLQLIA